MFKNLRVYDEAIKDNNKVIVKENRAINYYNDDNNEVIDPKMTAYEFFYDCNKDRLDEIAIKYMGNNITYRQFFDMIDNAANGFKQKGVKSGDFVSVCMLATPEGVATFYALDKIGAVSHMINVASSEEELTKYLNKRDSKLLVTHDIFYTKKFKNACENSNIRTVITSPLTDSLPLGINYDKITLSLITKLKGMSSFASKDDKCISYKELLELGKRCPYNDKVSYDASRPVSVCYTSGTTGESKGVVGTDFAANAMPITVGLSEDQIKIGDTMLATLPLWIYYSLMNSVHVPLCNNVTVALDPIFNPDKAYRRVSQYRFNHIDTIPTFLEKMVDSKRFQKTNLSCIKTIATGGDFLTPQLQAKSKRILNAGGSEIDIVDQGYGSSEVLGSFAYTYNENPTPGYIGKPLKGNKAKIVDPESLEELGENGIGELYLCTPSVMMEYLDMKEETEKVLVTDTDGNIWYKTGDLAHYNEKGEFAIDGRIRRIVMTLDKDGNPTKLIPDRIKKEILTKDDVYDCEVIPVTDDKRINAPVAYVVLDEDKKEGFNEKSLEKHCKDHLATYNVPICYRVVDTIPKTPGRKTDFKALEADYESYINENAPKTKIKRK